MSTDLPDTPTTSATTKSWAAERRVRKPVLGAEEERAIMIAAAYRTLARRGSGAAPVTEIIAESGLSTRSFYRHFKSKDDLLLAMFEAETERASQELSQRMRRASTPREAVETWVRFYLALAYDPRRRRRTLVMDSPDLHRAASYAEAIARTQEQHRVHLVRALEAGKAEGSFPRVRPQTDAVVLQDVVTSFVTRRRDGVERLGADDALAIVLDLLDRMIAPVS